MLQIYYKRYGPFHLFMRTEGRVKAHHFCVLFVKDTSDSQIVAAPHKKTFTYTLQMKLIIDHKFTRGTEIRQAATSSQQMCTAVYQPLPPSHPTPPPPPTLILFQAPVAFFYSADERDCLGLALMNWHYY